VCKWPLQGELKPFEELDQEDYSTGKDLPCSWIGRISILKMVILPVAFYVFPS
jgi:hypothetical protein